MASPMSKLLLEINLTTLKSSSVLINMCLPGRCSKVLNTAWSRVVENVFDLLKRLLAGLGEQEENVDEHGYAEDAEHDVDLPAWVLLASSSCHGYDKCLRMLANAGGTKYASAKLNAQLAEVAKATAFPRTRRGYNSAG